MIGERVVATYRVIKDRENPYVMMNKHGIYDNKLSWKAKGILMYFMSRPDNWEFHEIEIKKHARDGRDGTRAGIKELISNNYIRRKRERDHKGQFRGWLYEVYEVPYDVIEETKDSKDNKSISQEPTLEKATMDNSKTKNPMWEKSTLENATLLNNELTNNDFNNNEFNNKRFLVNKESKNLLEESEKERGVNHGDRGDNRENKESSSNEIREEERNRGKGTSDNGQAAFNEEDLI